MFQNETLATVVKFLAAINSGAEFTKCRFEAFMVQNEAVATVVKFLADINSAPDACSDPKHQRGSSSAHTERERARKNDRTENKFFFVFFLLLDLNSRRGMLVVDSLFVCRETKSQLIKCFYWLYCLDCPKLCCLLS